MLRFRMQQPLGRYSVCDEARRAPNNSEVLAGGGAVQHWGEDGEADRFDDLNEARGFAKGLWENAGRHHLIVIKDTNDNHRIVHALEPEPYDTPETSADDTRRLPSIAK